MNAQELHAGSILGAVGELGDRLASIRDLAASIRGPSARAIRAEAQQAIALLDVPGFGEEVKAPPRVAVGAAARRDPDAGARL